MGSTGVGEVVGQAAATARGRSAGGVNVVVLRGRLARPPETRELPSGTVVVGCDVTVPAGEAAGRAESVPVVWPTAPVGAVAHPAEGDEVVVVGRVRRRFFRAGGTTQSRTEVVAEHVVPARQRARWGRLLAASAERLTSG